MYSEITFAKQLAIHLCDRRRKDDHDARSYLAGKRKPNTCFIFFHSPKVAPYPCVLLGLREGQACVSPAYPPLHLGQQGLQVSQEVPLIALLHEARALLVPGAATGCAIRDLTRELFRCPVRRSYGQWLCVLGYICF